MWWGQVLDVTELKKAEEELRMSDAIVRQLPDAILITDPEGRIRRWLGNAEGIFGYTAEEAIGRPVSFLHYPDIKKRQTDKIIDDVNSTGRFLGEIPCLRKDGTVVPIETSAAPIYAESGEVWARIGINRDISERSPPRRRRGASHRRGQRGRIAGKSRSGTSPLTGFDIGLDSGKTIGRWTSAIGGMSGGRFTIVFAVGKT